MKPYFETDLGKLYHGDCFEIMSAIDGFDLIISDPPYGINHKSHGQLFNKFNPIVGDEDHKSYLFLDSFKIPLCLFFSPYNPPKIKWRSIVVWDKGPSLGGGGDRRTCWKRSFELIGIKNNPKLMGKRDEAVLKIVPPLIKESGHFCEKPINLMIYFLNKIPSSIIIDPFLGSGTTAIASENLGKKWIGIEIEEKYCEIAAKRIEKENAQLKLFDNTIKKIDQKQMSIL